MKKKKNDESKPRLFGGFGLPYGIVKSSVHIEITVIVRQLLMEAVAYSNIMNVALKLVQAR